MRPNSASRPVAYTTPVPSPALTIVPMNARSVGFGQLGIGRHGLRRLLRARRFAGQDAFVAFQAGDLDQPQVRGHGFAQRQPDDVAGDQFGDIDLANAPSRRTTAVWRTRECSAAAARSARYSLTKPRPMLATRMTPMMIACVLSPRKYETTAVRRQQDQHRAAQLTPQHRERVDLMGPNGIRAVARPSRRHLRAGQSLRELSSQPMTSSTGAAATRAAVSMSGSAGVGAFGVIDMAALPLIG